VRRGRKVPLEEKGAGRGEKKGKNRRRALFLLSQRRKGKALSLSKPARPAGKPAEEKKK